MKLKNVALLIFVLLIFVSHRGAFGGFINGPTASLKIDNVVYSNGDIIFFLRKSEQLRIPPGKNTLFQRNPTNNAIDVKILSSGTNHQLKLTEDAGKQYTSIVDEHCKKLEARGFLFYHYK